MERLTEKDLFMGNITFNCGEHEEDCDGNCQDKSCGLLCAVVKKIKKYEDLEEQGKLLKPPCSVGDMTYHVSKLFGIMDAIVIRIEVDSDGFWVITSSGTHSFDDFDKTVFLTREEAEAALKES